MIHPEDKKDGYLYKYYVLFYDKNDDDLTFPIKAVKDPVTQKIPYIAGYPAIFGGTREGNDSIRKTLNTEVQQESRQTCSIDALDNTDFTMLYRRTLDSSEKMRFYWVSTWGGPSAWPGPGTPPKEGEGEMSGVVSVSLKDIVEQAKQDANEISGEKLDFNCIMEALIDISGAPAPKEKKNEFLKSQTARAFYVLICAEITRQNL